MAYPYQMYAPFPQYPQYQQYYPQPTQQAVAQQQAMQPVQQNVQPQIQNGGFISVRSEAEAKNYPVAPGGSVTFIDENAPYCYTKSVGFSQLDRPTFKRFRLVEESDSNSIEKNVNQTNVDFDSFAKVEDVANIRTKYDALKSEFDKIKEEFENAFSNRNVKNFKTKKETDKE